MSQQDRSAMTGSLVVDDDHQINYKSIGDIGHPLLLFVVGSSGLGYLYHRIALELSSTFRCVYYDKRGFLPRETDHQIAAKRKNVYFPVQRHSDDAAAVIKHLSPHNPAYVFGTSTGGTAVLDLTVRYPELVHTAILHEPITFSVIRDSQLKGEMVGLYRRMADTNHPVEGFAMFADYMFQPSLARAVEKRTSTRPSAALNPLEVYNGLQGPQEAIAMVEYTVEEQAAQKVANKLVVVCGTESTHQKVSKPAKALAEVLGLDVRELPGDHMSFASNKHAAASSKQLLSILRERGQDFPRSEKRKARI